MKQNLSNAGFTMIELLLTIVLMSLVFVFGAKGFDYSPAAVQHAMLKVASNLRYAQDRAIVTGKVHGFQTINNTTYQIYESVPGNLTVDPATMGPMQVDLNNSFKGVTFQGNYQVEFNSLGTPTMGIGVNIVMEKAGVTRTISVNGNTGTLNLP